MYANRIENRVIADVTKKSNFADITRFTGPGE